MKLRSDGSIQSGNTPTPSNLGKTKDYNLYRCMVTKVTFADDPKNITKNSSRARVMYDVVVLGGFAEGQEISNCRLASTLGGNDNYFERVLKSSSKPLNNNRLNQQDGDVVFVQFIQGNPKYPVIIALDQGLRTSEIGATKQDGTIWRHKFNGLKAEINKDGDTTLTTPSGVKIRISETENKIVIDAATVELGEGATEGVILGDSFKSVFDGHIHGTPVGPSGPPTTPIPGSNISSKVKVK